jgi:signal transduction histidine kinase
MCEECDTREKRGLMPRVLVIDDQKIPRVSVARILDQAGYEVAGEASGAEGIERARQWCPDVIILDVQMPEMDGFAAVERLKQDPTTAAIPVIFLTATAQTDDLVVRGLDLGAHDFLSKDCSKAELLARVGVMARVKRSNDELSAIARIADTLLRTLDPVELSRLFVAQTREVFRADAALLSLPRADGRPPLRMGSGLDADEPLTDALAAALTDWLSEHQTEADVVPVEELRGPGGAAVRRHGFQSAVATVIARGNEAPALLAVLVRRASGFRRESDAPLLHLLLRQATIALDNALLHAHTREQAQKMEEQAEALERAMSERSRFFASMSHELRTPINAVIGYNQLLEEGTYGELSEQQKNAVEKVSRSAHHLLELINDVLDISKIEAGKIEIYPEETSLPTLISDTVTSLQLQAQEKNLALVVEIPEQLVIETDAARVRQILLNLLSNAVKFTDEGSVRVVCEVDGLMERNGGRTTAVEIHVIDTGQGIPPEDQDRIFEEFEQVGSASRGGTGLGLAISQKLARLLGGELRLQSKVGVGSTFTLRLPASHATQ